MGEYTAHLQPNASITNEGPVVVRATTSAMQQLEALIYSDYMNSSSETSFHAPDLYTL